jgi:hypothetical protein
LAKLEAKSGCLKQFKRTDFKFVQCGLQRYNQRLRREHKRPIQIRSKETRHPFGEPEYATFDKVMSLAKKRFGPARAY